MLDDGAAGMKPITFVLMMLVLIGCVEKMNIPEKINHPNCSGVERWPTSMAFVYLKNAGLTDNDIIDFTKTKTTRLASEYIGKDLFVQVHFVVFTEKSGKKIQVITKNEASYDECSMSGVEVYVISKVLGE